MKDMEKTEMLDLLEKSLVQATQRMMGEADFKISEKQARNLVAKIGSRILFAESLGKERTDEILTK